ncbi:MAG: ArsR family transcriptional regulator [Bacillota bacterium]|nr:ArsR family transcriptional regulator [Bacillota bacterium]
MGDRERTVATMRARRPVPEERRRALARARGEKNSIVALLKKAGASLTVPQIAEGTGLAPEKVMRHLASLRKYGQVREEFLKKDYYTYAVVEGKKEE